MNKSPIYRHGSKPKIMYVITKSNWGGAQRYVYDMATALPAGDACVVLGGSGLLSVKLREAGVKVIQVGSMSRDINIGEEARSILELYKIFRREKPDIVHLNSSKAGGLGAFVARLAGVPRIIFTAHAWAFNEDRGVVYRVLIKFLHWLTIIFAHRTIAVSQNIKDQISGLPFVSGKITVIKNGVRAGEQLGLISREESGHRLGIESSGNDGDCVRICTIGELHPIKGHKYALEALAVLKKAKPEIFNKIKYYIIGEGEIRNELELAVDRLGLRGSVHLLGFVDGASKYLKAFDIFLLPSLSEALGYVLLEAGLASVPVIASAVGGVPEIVEDNVSGLLVPPADSGRIAKAIEQLVTNPDKRIKLANSLCDKVGREFDLDKVVQGTLNVYSSDK